MRKTFQKLIMALMAVIAVSCGSREKSAPEKKDIWIIHNLSHRHVSFYQFMSAVEEAFPDTSLYHIDYSAVTEAYLPWTNEDFSDILLSKLDRIQEVGGADLLILYSDQVLHAAARCHHPLLDSIPVLFTGSTWPEHEGRLRDRKNFTGCKTPLAIKETLDMMRDMDCKPWALINLDSTYLDRYLREEICRQLGDDTLHYVTNLDYSAADRMIPEEERDQDKTTLIPIQIRCKSASGFEAVKMLNCAESGCTYLRIKDDKSGIVSLSNPVGIFYSATPERFNLSHHSAINACAGGCFVSSDVMMKEMRIMADKILFEGRKPEDIPWKTLQPEWWLDWKVLKNNFTFGNELPRYANVTNLPWKEKNIVNNTISDYWVFILILILFISLMSAMLILHISNQAKTRRLLKEGQDAERLNIHMEESLAAANCHFFRVTRGGRILFNESFKEMCGELPVPSNAIQFAELISPDKKDEFLGILDGKDMQERIRNISFAFMGHHFASRIAVNGDDMQSDKAYGILFNMDTNYQIEHQRSEAFKLEEQSTMKRAFLASMGHEIRTPLNAILGYSRLLFDMYDDIEEEEKGTYSEVIRQNSEQLLSLIDNVLTNSSKEGMEPEIVLSQKRVSDLMEELYMTYRVIIPAHLQFNFTKGDTEEFIMVNRGSMLQVLSNLLNNAVKFTPEGSITMGWRDDGNDVVIYVEDTGCGIPEDKIDTIFEKYSKVRESTEGAGIGLSLCKKLVDKMGGRINVTSAPDSGSCFQVIFPRISV